MLSTEVFQLCLSQNSSSASDLEKNLKAIVPHAFGDHVYCDSRWCQFMKDPAQYKHRSLPYGKDLCGEDLRKDLDRVLNVYIVNSSDLVRIGSSQGNESLNMVIASKAPKAKHYSGSNSFNFRVAAAVAQKNLGHTYVSQVHKENLLSPSRTCQIYGAKLDRKTQKVNDRAKTKKGKLERLQRKEKRAQKTAATEVREGSTYEKGVGLSMSSEQCRNEILEPVLPPDSVSLSEGSYTPVVFDIETTSAYSTAEITQIAAVSGDDQFSQYILPKQPICRIASEKTRLTVKSGKLCYEGKPVPTVPKQTCLESFIEFICKFENPILVAHNARSFDCRYLLQAMNECSLTDQFVANVCGFVDSLPVFRSLYPDRASYSQESLVNDYVGQDYEAHNAVADVFMLQKLLKVCQVSLSMMIEKSFTSHWMIQYLTFKNQQSTNYKTLITLVNNKVLSESMAKRVAGSGLNYSHLLHNIPERWIR
ncbi:uncharacterized protein [Ptychodera flava]|uniref:uncharacterized protein n=1 Tax=Ptychodera flava TaxID=63121 RepID=UPI00396A3A33